MPDMLTSLTDDATLTAAARRSCAKQWRSFVEGLAAALSRMVGDEQALLVLSATGAEMAAARPLGVCGSLAGLAEEMNAALGEFDWGSVEIRDCGRALELTVAGYPYLDSLEGRAAFVAALEGLLGTWLQGVSDQPGLALQLTERGTGEYPSLQFRYGLGGS